MIKRVSMLVIVAAILFNFHAGAQHSGLVNFIKKEGYVKFTDSLHLPPAVKQNYRSIEKYFASNHLNKSEYYIKLQSTQAEDKFLSVFIIQISTLRKLKKQKEQNQPPVPGGVGDHDGTLIINLKTGVAEFRGLE